MSTPPGTRSSRTLLIVIAVVALGVVALALGAVLLVGLLVNSVPTEVTAGTALVETDAGAGTAESNINPEGTWTVDTSVRAFSFEESAGTFVGFRVAEELASIGAAEAVGRTPEVTGELTVEGATITAAAIGADVSVLVTDDSRRDRRARAAMGADDNPLVSFVLTEAIDLGEVPVVGTKYLVDATGDLTINGVTVSVVVPLTAVLDPFGVLAVTGSFDVTLADYAITAPSAPIVLSVADVATVELQLLLTHA